MLCLPEIIIDIHASIDAAVSEYVSTIDPEQSGDLYKCILHATELALLKKVMHTVKDNNTRAAKLLGISRNTLRKKLSSLGISQTQ